LANPNRAKSHIISDLRRHLVRCSHFFFIFD
jgi:hypothetical protein